VKGEGEKIVRFDTQTLYILLPAAQNVGQLEAMYLSVYFLPAVQDKAHSVVNYGTYRW
jgi:hypothetical protein